MSNKTELADLHKCLRKLTRKQGRYALFNMPYICGEHPLRASISAIIIIPSFIGAYILMKELTEDGLGEYARELISGLGVFAWLFFMYIESVVFISEWKYGKGIASDVRNLVEKINTLKKSQQMAGKNTSNRSA